MEQGMENLTMNIFMEEGRENVTGPLEKGVNYQVGEQVCTMVAPTSLLRLLQLQSVLGTCYTPYIALISLMQPHLLVKKLANLSWL